jgi:hypothetical protein
LAVDSRKVEWTREPTLGKHRCEHDEIPFIRELGMADSAVRHRKAKLLCKAERLTEKIDSRRGISIQEVRYDALFTIEFGHRLFLVGSETPIIAPPPQYLTQQSLLQN